MKRLVSASSLVVPFAGAGEPVGSVSWLTLRRLSLALSTYPRQRHAIRPVSGGL